MRSSAGFVSLAIVALAFAGCGNAKTVVTTTAATSPSGTATRKPLHTPAPRITTVSYAVHLAAIKPARRRASKKAPKAVPNRSAFAAISVNAATNELCWTFSQLKNVTAPDEAQLRGNLPGETTVTELSDANGLYKASECAKEPQLLLSFIEQTPHRFILNIQNHNHPEHGVSGQL